MANLGSGKGQAAVRRVRGLDLERGKKTREKAAMNGFNSEGLRLQGRWLDKISV